MEVPPAKGEFRGVSYSPAGEKGPIQTKFFRGEIEGEILQELGAPILPRIPLSSVFLADGATKVFAAMSEAEKAKFSHRGRALELAKKFLENELK